jgi:3-oxoacyl-[acyl-carrier protein] reductase
LDFSGKKILVTGATRGIGEAIADAYAEAGAELILTGTQQQAIDDLNAKGQEGREYWCVDFSDADSTDAFCARLDGLDRLDVCVNNAGINLLNPIDKIETGDLDAVLDVNLRAPFLVCRSASRIMKKQQYGRIVNIASIWSVISKSGRAAYSGTKFGIVGMTKSLAADLGSDGILVNAVSPGFIVTEMTAKNLSAEEREELAAEVPLGRFGQPEEIANVVLFLSSDMNTYISGQNIVTDGGFTSV